MKLATTTSDFSWYVKSQEECAKLIHDAGFRYMDFAVAGPRFFLNDNWRDETLRLRDYVESLDMKYVQAHSPEGDVFDPERMERYLQRVIRSIEICKLLDIPQTVVHSGFKEGVGKDEFYEKNLAFYKRLYPVMEKTGVNVLIENTTRTNMPPEKYYFFFKGKEMVEFLNYANHPLLHAVWDTGHGNTEGNQYEDIIALGNELYGIHVHDNSERCDEHTLPYFGTLNMDALMNALIDVNYQGYFTFEVVSALRRSDNPHGKRHVFERDTRLLEPTLEMQIDLERLLYAVGKHALSSYDVYEE